MKLCVFRCLILRPQTLNNYEVSKYNSMKMTSFSKTTSSHREPFLTMFFTYQPLPITPYQVVLCANNYFE